MYFKKKIGVLLLGLMLIFSTAAAAQTLPNPDTSAESACLIDAEDNAVLYGKDENKIMHPASTTKIMTAIIALESGKLDEPLVISSYAVNTEPSSLGLRMGDRITLREALAGMLLVSGNDAAVAVAETVAGSVPEFARLMNEKARELGAYNTHFVNPHGLTAQGHYTTAHDMAIIAAYAMKNPLFREMVGRTTYNMKYMDGHTKYVTTTNRFLKSGFPGANGIKTGFTNAAGDCLVASATRGLKTMIAVFYNDDYRWDDAQVWLEFGFSFYDPSELRDRPARPVNENLAKITERIRQNRETNSNLAALDKAVAERAKNISFDNGAENKAETVSELVDETADTAENDNTAAKTDTDKTVTDEPAEVQTDKDSDDVNDIYAYTESDDNADITEETNPALAQYVY
ncbi:D-alanyl-D-alanine carboxypeptidase family protein [Megamonas hypermegale]|uniref:D-alanyl-D-alanine carboxypeptidase family protein n=1 Tax=Megamonas hypermegale TaxID=158847 RepID=UPI0025A41446|nr:D-alanyl-D-alanine carboxypeptidase family protein [Megamonas hypermegale]MDM8142471.1 D-alanyl-D-alanine carboxypeptidase family protein [Megamonas hypermegale]